MEYLLQKRLDMKFKVDGATFKALQLYVRELKKLAVKYHKKRFSEIAKMTVKFANIEFTRDGLVDAYGYQCSSCREYEKALDTLEQSEYVIKVAAVLKLVFSDLPRILNEEIKRTESEINEIKSK